jgi:hypothetical protein
VRIWCLGGCEDGGEGTRGEPPTFNTQDPAYQLSNLLLHGRCVDAEHVGATLNLTNLVCGQTQRLALQHKHHLLGLESLSPFLNRCRDLQDPDYRLGTAFWSELRRTRLTSRVAVAGISGFASIDLGYVPDSELIADPSAALIATLTSPSESSETLQTALQVYRCPGGKTTHIN